MIIAVSLLTETGTSDRIYPVRGYIADTGLYCQCCATAKIPPGDALSTRGLRVVRWRIRELLAEREMSLYEFARAIGYAKVGSVYRRFPVDGEFRGDVNAKLLDRICTVLGVGVGDILEHVPDTPTPRSRKR